jgi:hypothetical protein
VDASSPHVDSVVASGAGESWLFETWLRPARSTEVCDSNADAHLGNCTVVDTGSDRTGLHGTHRNRNSSPYSGRSLHSKEGQPPDAVQSLAAEEKMKWVATCLSHSCASCCTGDFVIFGFKESGKATKVDFFNTFHGAYLCFVGFALVGVLPRCLVLLLSQTIPSVTLSEAMTGDFKELWAPCHHPSNSFSAFGPNGTYHKFMGVADHGFTYLGLTLAYLGLLYGTFPVALERRNGKMLMLIFASAGAINGMASFAYILRQFTSDDLSIDGMRLVFDVRINFVNIFLFISFVAFTCMSTYVQRSGAAVVSGGEGEGAAVGEGVRGKAAQGGGESSSSR